MIDREKLYNLIYDKANKLLKEYNPCNIHLNPYRLLVCNNKRYDTGNGKLCCSMCKYSSDKGCTTKCLACKVALCECDNKGWVSRRKFNKCCDWMDVDTRFREKMYKLVRLAQIYKLFVLRASKKETFERNPILEEVII